MGNPPCLDCCGLRVRPNGFRPALKFTLTLIGWAAFASIASAQTNIVNYHYDVSRSGLNSNETILTPSNVNSTQFGKLFSQPVDGYIFAQPLYVQNVPIPGKGTHNVVYVATENDSVYAFDADSNSGTNGNPLWQASMIDAAHGAPPGARASTSSDVNCTDTKPLYGITGTPTIDLATATMYLVAKSTENGAVVDRLHAIDITTGAEKSPGPVVISPTVTGTGDGSSGGQIALDQATDQNRAGLLLLSGKLYVAYGSICDLSPYHGWLMQYDEASLAQTAVFNTSPNGGMGGIWMAGDGLAVDSSSNLYFASGNGTYDGSKSWGDSVIKMSPPTNGTFSILDWFTPYDQQNLATGNIDQGSGGILLIPDQPAGSPAQHLLITGGKDGTIYLLNRDNLGHFNASGNGQVWQSLPNAIPGLWSTAAWWNNNVYLAGSGDIGQGSDSLRAFAFDPNTDMLSGVSTSNSPTQFSFPAPSPVVSANGTSNGIVWVIESDQFANSGPAILRAYDATNLANELYDSSQNLARDNPGAAVKFTVPVVVNGQVYVGTETQLSVFGEIPLLAGVSVSPSVVTGGNGSTGTVQLSSPAPQNIAVTLSSSNSGVASVPASVTISTGGTSATFPITTTSVGSSTPVTITATYGNASPTAVLTVNPIGGSAVSFVRSAGGSAESVPYTVSITPAAGDFLAVAVWQEESAATPSVADNVGSTYTPDCDLTYDQGFGLRRLTVFHLLNASGGITGVTITPNKPSRAVILEYSGMPTSGSVLDVCGPANTQTTASTSWSSAAASTSGEDLALGLADTGFTAAARYSSSGSWVSRLEQGDPVGNDDSFVEDQTNVGQSTLTATGTTTASVIESAVIVAFKTGSSSPTPPTITSANHAAFAAGVSSSFAVTASGSAPITFTETGALPSGVTFSTSGVLGGTPATGTQGTYAITITASNGVPPSATQNFTLTVNPSTSSTPGATARQFASSSQYATNGTGYLSGATAFTLSFWAKLANSNESQAYAIESDTGSGSQWAVIYGYTAGSYEFFSYAGSTGVGPERSGSAISITDTNWHHIVYRYDGTTWCYFLDGAKHVISSSIAFTLPSATQFSVANSNLSTNPFGASISELIVDNSALSDAQVAQLYALTNPTTMGLGSKLTGYWPMGLASPEPDDSGNNHALTLFGSPASVAGPAGSSPQSAPAITSANSATFTVGSAGSFTVTATGSPTPTFSESGTLPSGVTFSSAGVLSGTPATGTQGTFPFTITASNGISPDATQSFTLTVNAQSTSGAAFVKVAGNYGESVPYTVSIAPIAGHFLAVFVWQIEGADTPRIADNVGSAYAMDCNLTYDQGFGLRRLTVYHLSNAQAGITSITVTPSTPSRAIVAEYSGMASTASLDVCGTVNNQNTNVTTWNSTPTGTRGASDIIFGLVDSAVTSTAHYAASSAWNGRLEQADTVDTDDSYVEDELNVPAGTYTAGGSSATAARESTVVVGYKTQ